MVFQVEVRWNVKQMGPVIKSVVDACAKEIQTRSRQDIASSGIRKPGRYVKGLTTKVSRIQKGYAIGVFLRPAYAKVWEYGGTSVGKPLLWIALPGSPKRVRSYGGKLFRPPGRNVLLSQPSRVRVAGIRGSGTGKPQIKYIGIRSATHRPRFHLRKIAMEEANKVSQSILRLVK